MSGSNRSGDLSDAQKSIPSGTIAAVVTTTIMCILRSLVVVVVVVVVVVGRVNVAMLHLLVSYVLLSLLNIHTAQQNIIISSTLSFVSTNDKVDLNTSATRYENTRSAYGPITKKSNIAVGPTYYENIRSVIVLVLQNIVLVLQNWYC